MSNQNSAAYTIEMDPTQSGAQPTQPYTTPQTTTTTTHTSRGTDRGPTTTGTYVTAPGATTGERVSSGEGLMGKMKGAAAAVHGTGEALRGAFNTGVDNMAGDVRIQLLAYATPILFTTCLTAISKLLAIDL